MLQGAAGKIAIDLVLPKDLRDPSRVWDSKTTKQLLTELAETHPEKYKEVIDQLLQISRVGATYSRGFSFGLDDLRPSPFRDQYVRDLNARAIELVYSKLPNRQEEQDITPLVEINNKYYEKIKKQLEEEQNPIYALAKAGIRGNETVVKRFKHAEPVYIDSWDRPIPYPIFNNFSIGMSPAEYWASAYGSKRGIVTTKLAPGQAGYIYKQMVQAAHRLVVVKDKGPFAGEKRGVPISLDSPDILGYCLAEPVAGFREGTVITKEVLAKLKDKKLDSVLVYSPIAGGPPDGIYGIQVGWRGGRFPKPGDLVGLWAAQGIGERLSQSSVGKKHQGIVRGGITNIAKTVDQLLNMPENFPGGAAHATVEGRVESIKPAPAGGYYVSIKGVQHYIPPGVEVFIKPGAYVEAGDVLSGGLPNPEMLLKYKGIGEARRVFAETLLDVLRGGGLASHRINTEIIAKALFNYVQFDKFHDGNVPGDVVKYDTLEHFWRPREGSKAVDPSMAIGQYLEAPVLHYTIGTRITRSIAKQLANYNINRIVVHPEPPPFTPIAAAARTILQYDPSWMAKFLGSYQKRTLLESAAYGGVTEKYRTTSFVPALAEGVQFGKKWPEEVLQPFR